MNPISHLLAGAAIPLVLVVAGCDKPAGTSAGRDPDRGGVVPAAGTVESRPLPVRAVRAEGEALFEALPAGRTGIDYGMHWDDPASVLKEFIFLNPSGGICAGDYDDDGLPDLYITSPSGGNRLYRNTGGFKFEDVTKAAGVSDPGFWGTGASFVDIDDDGDLDLYACGYTRPNKLYINDGTGRFVDRAAEVGLDFNGGSMMMSFTDIDNDGDLDGYLATTAVAPPPGTDFRVKFVPRESDGKEIPVVIPELSEYWEILIKPGDKAQRVEAGQRDRLFRNDGGQFVDVSRVAGIKGAYFTLSSTWIDYDADGDADLYVSNDFTGPDMLYRNRGDGTFEDVAREAVPHTPWFSMGSDVGDLDNDGLLDLFASDMSASSHYREKVMMGNMDDMGWFLEWPEPRQYMRNALLLNSGTGRFREAAFLAGLASTDWTWTPRIEDYDQDGRADIYVTNGVMRDNMNSDLSDYSRKNLQPGTPEYARFWLEKPLRKEKNMAFRNLGDLKFKSAGAEWGLEHLGVSFGAASADFDGDGDPDLAVSNAGEPVTLYRNRVADTHRVVIKLMGRASNRDGLGATITVTTAMGKQTRFVTAARGWLSASDTAACFGLGSARTIDRIEILWPGGTRQLLTDLEADHYHLITEPVGQPDPPADSALPVLFERSDHLSTAIHREQPFDDFSRQPLLPNKLSRQGPCVAWGDLDGDGDEDFFLGGSRGYPGQIHFNGGDGRFSVGEVEALAADAGAEDLGALFFDADSDGDRDLFVASGGVEEAEGHVSYRDRLYLNDGRGGFSPAEKGALPDFRTSSGPVAAGDFDRDGDLDLFVGGRVVPGSFPLAPPSHLLINTDGTFVPAGPEQFPGADKVGMVTGALWSDVDDDGWSDLLLTVEWGPVRYFRNEEGALVDRTAESQLADRLGWWNGIAGGDIDGDGDLDYLVTNNGLNSKYKASPESPELIYYGDLDGSGKSHLVEAKYDTEGRLLPRRGFSCSRDAMPFLDAKLETFHNFASAVLDDIYSDLRLSKSLRREANVLESGILVNDGSAVFTWRSLPRIAQIAPSYGVVLEDLDGDGDLDAVLAQNSFSPQRETGRMDGGLGQVLLNDGGGQFTPVAPVASGVEVPGAGKSLSVVDLNTDGRLDLVFGINEEPVMTFLRRGGKLPLRVRLVGTKGNPQAVGARVRLGHQLREQQVGGGYSTRSGGLLCFARPGRDMELSIRWPDGSESTHQVRADTDNILTIAQSR